MTKETKLFVAEDEGTGALFVRGRGRFEVFYTLKREQKLIIRHGVGSAPGKGSITGTIRKHDGSFLALSFEFPVEAILLTEPKAQLTINLERDGTFIAGSR